MKAPIKTATKADADAAKQARKWKKELDLAGKREKEWREAAEKVVKRYRGEEKKKNRFNVLWSNTETLRPAIYNSRPNPDVRRRFRDADPLGKAVSEILERSLMVMVDLDATDQNFKNDTLDALLPGRGLSRIRYIPSLAQVGEKAKPPGADTEEGGGKKEDSQEEGSYGGETQEEVEYEQVCTEHVDWRDYREGYGRTWDEVPCTFYRHKLTRADAEEKFGKQAVRKVKFTVPTTDDPKKQGDDANETQKVAEFWEVWDKVGEQVFFIEEDTEQLLFPIDNPDGTPPLHFTGFFPHPEPMKLIENTGSLLPIIPFTLYETQANELDKISARIDRITDAMRLRGVYDAKLTELGDLMTADDNELTPVQNAQAWIEGGLDKAITWFPTEKAAAMLEALYEARTRQKAIIDELTGISDIVRGATDPDETLGAQQLKQTNYSVRLSRMQKEVQRYAKDMLRLASEAMCEKFVPQTFGEMTELQFPTQQQKQMAQAQAAQPPQPGAPPPPNPALALPSWEEIMGLMRSPSMRRFKVDIETDSTVASTLNSDMTGMAEVLKAVGETLSGMGPMVQSGSLPVDAAKELIMAVVRRSRLGMAVEDAFDKMKAPNPPGPPEAVQVAQIKAQTDKENIQAKTQADIAKNQAAQQAQTQNRQAELQMEGQKAQLDAQIELQKDQAEKQHELVLKTHEADLRLRELAMTLENQRLIADANNQTKVQCAEIAAKASLDAASLTAASYDKEEQGVNA